MGRFLFVMGTLSLSTFGREVWEGFGKHLELVTQGLEA